MRYDLTVALADCLDVNRADRTLCAMCRDAWGFECHPRCDLLVAGPDARQTGHHGPC